MPACNMRRPPIRGLPLLLLQIAVPASKRGAMSGRFYLTHFMPTGFFMALTFLTGNAGYLYLTVRRYTT